MTRRKQFQPKRMSCQGQSEVEGQTEANGDDEDEDEKDGTKQSDSLDMQVDSIHSNHSNHSDQPDQQSDDFDEAVTDASVANKENNDSSNLSKDEFIEESLKHKIAEIKETRMTIEAICVKKIVFQNGDSADHNHKPVDQHVNDENESEISKVETKMNESDIEREVKKELKEAVEIRIPKLKTQKSTGDYKWMYENGETEMKQRPETPPLQKLMRQDFSPLKSNYSMSPSPPKKLKESSSTKEGYMSKLASVIVPSTTIPLRTASHPKQLLSHSIASLRNSSQKPFVYTKPLHSSLPLSSPRPYPSPKSMFQNQNSDQPLDLSKKSKDKDNDFHFSNGHESRRQSPSRSVFENGISSTSLQSLQMKFGGDFHLRGLRKPTNYLMYGPEIPALHQALLHSAALPLPYHSYPISNGLLKLKPDHTASNLRHRNSTPSPHKSKQEDGKSLKKEEPLSEKSMKQEKFEPRESESNSVPHAATEERPGEKYTNHLCMCGKSFDGLYALSLHLQETGHLPARSKSVSLLEYPKLVRGQDMWLNQESEQTRRILRCIQCGESFKTLPMLTVHMMKTQHYTKIVSAEHTRRTHKCSAYCDKEQDKECVFKCKVCQDTFSDMEGLANHMLLSGHHKKQHISHTNGPSEFRQKRKRYSFEDNYNPFSNPTVAALLDYKRKIMPDRISPNSYFERDGDSRESRISCENCGRKIETKLFVDHVRGCLGQKLSEEILHRERLKRDRYERLRGDYDLKEDRLLRSPLKKRKSESPSSHSIKSENSVKEDGEIAEKNQDSIHVHNDITNCDDKKKDEKDSIKSVSDIDKSDDNSKEMNIEKEIKKEVVEGKSVNNDRLNDESYNSLKEIQAHIDSLNSSLNDSKKSDPVQKHENDGYKDKCEKKSGILGKKLDIIDPNATGDESGSSSALSAMESFIKKSFSSRFDYKKGNIIINPNSSLDASVHPRPSSSAMSPEGMDYFNHYKKLYSSFNIHNGFGFDIMDGKKPCHKPWHDDVDRDKETEGLKLNTIRDKAASSPGSENGLDKEDDRSSVKSLQSDHSSSLDKNENLEKKYLTLPKSEEDKKTDKQSSALDNLSSFVYGQPLTSEHPLDSLQRLITKADIPKLMASHGACAFKYLPPHLKLTQSNPDLTVPLNLSAKSNHGDSNDEDDDDDDRLRPDDDSLSDYEAVNSPTNSDGDPIEYRCAACSRRFATKGSYRYHLSRCHLSSVKRYGIKEAFNMSPYVYLPLDHTAKFSKYYEMAKELANKGK